MGGVLGGSLTGVLELIAQLDRRRFEPMLVLFEPKPIVGDLEILATRAGAVAEAGA